MILSALPEEMSIRYEKEMSKLADKVIDLSNLFVKECQEKNLDICFEYELFLVQFSNILNNKILENKKRKEDKNVD